MPKKSQPGRVADIRCQQARTAYGKKKATLGVAFVQAEQAQCTPCIFFFIQGVSSISTRPAPMGMAVKIRKKTDIE